MKTYSVGEFKSNFSAILEKVKHGEEIGVSYGKTKEIIAVLTSPKKKMKKRKLGLLEGKVEVKFFGDWDVSPEALFNHEIPA
ncbi:MAG: prevent-host-death protein [Saprospiraceae bacterium]